jgi:hypothetical protein
MVSPIRWRGAGQGNQVGFLLPIQAPGACPTERATGERCVQSLLGKHSSHSDEGRRAHLQGFADLFISPAWALFARVCLQQYPCMQQPAGGFGASRDKVLQLLALCLRQAYAILYHEGLLESV